MHAAYSNGQLAATIIKVSRGQDLCKVGQPSPARPQSAQSAESKMARQWPIRP